MEETFDQPNEDLFWQQTFMAKPLTAEQLKLQPFHPLTSTTENLDGTNDVRSQYERK